MIRLKAERLVRGWSQMEVAHRAGLHPSDISRIENGEEPYPNHAEQLMEVFGLESPEQLTEQVTVGIEEGEIAE